MNSSQQLFQYARDNNYEGMENLLLSGVSPNWYYSTVEYHETLLHYAVRHRNEKMIILLLANGADLAAQDRFGRTPMHLAKCLKEPDIISCIAHCKNTNPRDTFHYYQTLEYLVKKDDPVLLKKILSAGVNPSHTLNIKDAQERSYKTTALHLTIQRNQKDLTKLLLDYGADLAKEDERGLTPMQHAKSSMVKFVAELKSTDEADSFRYGSQLCSYGTLNPETTYTLINANAPIDSLSYHSNTPLHIAAIYEKPANAFILISFDANTNAINLDNKTPKGIRPEYFQKEWLENQLDLKLASVAMVFYQAARQGKFPYSATLIVLYELAKHYNHFVIDIEAAEKTAMQLKNISKDCLLSEYKKFRLFDTYSWYSKKVMKDFENADDENCLNNYISDEKPKENEMIKLFSKYHFFPASESTRFLQQKKSFDDSLAECDKAISDNKNDAGKYYQRACLHHHAGNIKLAYKDYCMANQLNPESTPTCIQFGRLLSELESHEQLQGIDAKQMISAIKKFRLDIQVNLFRKCQEENSPLNIFIRKYSDSGINKLVTTMGYQSLMKQAEAYLQEIDKDEKVDHTPDF